MVLTSSTFVKASFTKVYPLTLGATESYSYNIADTTFLALMSCVYYILTFVLKNVEILLAFLFSTCAAQIVILNDFWFEP